MHLLSGCKLTTMQKGSRKDRLVLTQQNDSSKGCHGITEPEGLEETSGGPLDKHSPRVGSLQQVARVSIQKGLNISRERDSVDPARVLQVTAVRCGWVCITSINDCLEPSSGLRAAWLPIFYGCAEFVNPSKIPKPNSRSLHHAQMTMSLRATSPWLWNTPRDGDSTTSLGSCTNAELDPQDSAVDITEPGIQS